MSQPVVPVAQKPNRPSYRFVLAALRKLSFEDKLILSETT